MKKMANGLTCQPGKKRLPVIIVDICAQLGSASLIWQHARLGTKRGYYNYSMGSVLADEGFNVMPNERIALAVESAIAVVSPQYDRYFKHIYAAVIFRNTRQYWRCNE